MDDSTCFVQDIDQFVKVHAPDMDFQVVWLPTSIVDYCSKVKISMGAAIVGMFVSSITEQGNIGIRSTPLLHCICTYDFKYIRLWPGDNVHGLL